LESEFISMNYPSGWHAVPGTDQERYWDGEKWTDAYRKLDGATSVSFANNPGFSNAPGTSGQAIASMVLGIVSLVIFYLGLVTAIVGLCLGVAAIKKCKPRGPLKGRGMAKAGIICSIIALALWLIVLIAVAAAAGS
jgi:hypothetical protein